MKRLIYAILFLIVLVLAVSFAAKNHGEVTVMYYFNFTWTGSLSVLLFIVLAIGSLLGVLLSIALVAVTFNTIRLQILTRRDEIEVSKLIGATNHFIRRPFLYLGGLQGLLGGVAAWLIVAIAVRMLNHELASFGGLFGLSPSLGHMTLQQIAVLLALAALLGWLGAWMAVSRHLWRMEPR